jgi:L-malate glycosyltransferase
MKALCITDCADRPETELFIRLAQRAEQFAVISNPEGRYHALLLDAGLTVIPLKIRGRFDREATDLIRTTLYEGDYDIVHAFNSRAVTCMLRAARGHRARLLAYRGVTTGVGYGKPEAWLTFLNPRLDGIMCVAEAIQRALLDVRFLWLHLPAEKVKTIHKGHELAWYAVEPAALSELGIPAGAKTLCCISRNSAKKGALTLLDAFDNLPADLNCHLLLIGSVDSNPTVCKRVAHCAHPERIHFTGYRNDVTQILSAADLLVSASESGEGLPRVVIEAMAVNTPVVATDAGGTRELVLDGETGLLVPQRDAGALAAAITQTLQDSTAAKKRSAAARAHIEQVFNAETTAVNTFAWYQERLDSAP